MMLWDLQRQVAKVIRARSSKPFGFGWICGFLETVRKIQESGSPLFVGGNRALQKILDRSIATHPSAHRDRCDSFSHLDVRGFHMASTLTTVHLYRKSGSGSV